MGILGTWLTQSEFQFGNPMNVVNGLLQEQGTVLSTSLRPGAHGPAVRTPEATIKPDGTSFLVHRSAAQRASFVHVGEGAVSIAPLRGATLRLVAGQSAVVNARGARLLVALPATSTAGCQGFAGSWQGDFGPQPMQVQGNRVTGTYTQPSGTIDGVVNGAQFEGSWRQRDRSGRLQLVLSADGQSFSGRWTEANGSGGGAWNGRCTAGPAVPVAPSGQPPAGLLQGPEQPLRSG